MNYLQIIYKSILISLPLIFFLKQKICLDIFLDLTLVDVVDQLRNDLVEVLELESSTHAT